MDLNVFYSSYVQSSSDTRSIKLVGLSTHCKAQQSSCVLCAAAVFQGSGDFSDFRADFGLKLSEQHLLLHFSNVKGTAFNMEETMKGSETKRTQT